MSTNTKYHEGGQQLDSTFLLKFQKHMLVCSELLVPCCSVDGDLFFWRNPKFNQNLIRGDQTHDLHFCSTNYGKLQEDIMPLICLLMPVY